uniref:Uncharacterized protein n=1 Tax=Anguilla anguilla TaxID=7936 RepID=A0A0E9W8L3_ANGAN
MVMSRSPGPRFDMSSSYEYRGGFAKGVCISKIMYFNSV